MSAAVTYRVSSADPRTHLLDIEMTIAQPAAEQKVSLPTWIPGSYMVREFSRHLQGLQAKQGRTPLATRQLNKNTWVLRCQADRPLTLRYQVYAFDNSVRAAYLDGQRCFFNGTSVCLQAHGLEHQAHDIEVAAPRRHGHWRVATGLPAVRINAAGWGRYRAEIYDELIDSPFEMGDFWSGQFVVSGVPHRFVVSGAPSSFDGERLLADTQRICQAAIRLWHGRGKPAHRHYVFMLNVVGDGYGGLEHRHSTALIASRRDLPRLGESAASEGYVTLLGLISHEYFHTWNVKRLRPQEFARYDLQTENYTELLWFFEGFTSYFDDLLLVRAGLLKPAAYLERLAKTIASVAQTPGRKVQSVAQSSFDAWVKYYRQDENTPNATVSYYTKGSLVALCLDLALRAEGTELASVMRGLWKRCAAGPMSEADVLAELQAQTGRSWQREIRAWVHGTGELPLATLLRAQGVIIDAVRAPMAQRLGLRVSETANGIQIKTVLRDGAAEQAGMAAGDEWLAVEVGSGTKARMWRLKKLDELGLWLGRGQRCRALVCRDQQLYWLDLRVPQLASNWTLKPGAELKGWI
ncbi:MAG: peptidase M61 [Alphaproteobacteria bacterium]|nr:peptidase M61 [Alphaproteobacteria bacterium]